MERELVLPKRVFAENSLPSLIREVPATEPDELVLVDVMEEEGRQIILYNDDVHTFDFVIEALITVCRHDPIQAEQCTYLVHYKGRCSVKKGSYEELEPMCTALLDRGLTAEIE